MTSQITASPDPGAIAPTRLETLGAIELTGPEGSLRAVLAQPKRLALLVYLATESQRGFVRRDKVIAVFWPECDQTRGRTSLRQALRFLRSSLGESIFDRRGDEEIAVDPRALMSDVAGFEQAMSERRLEDALDAYRGDFLAGFFVAGSGPELDQWIEDQRSRLRQLAMRAATTLATSAESARDLRAAARWARRAVAISPHDEAAQRALIRILDAGGDKAGALHAYETFARRLEREMDAEPATETQRLASRIRDQGTEPPSKLPERSAVRATPIADTRLSIVVVPFQYVGPDDERHLGHGLADEIREALRAVGDLNVASRLESMAFEGADLERREVRDRLRARAALTGRVERDGARLTVAAQLRDVSTGRELWADVYSRDMTDIFAMEERLARAVVGALRISLAADAPSRLVRQPTHDLEAYNLYLRGRFHWMRRPRESRKGLEYFERAIARDPLFALAHAGIADVYNTLGSWEAAEIPSWDAFPRARAAAMQALAIDPSLAEAHTPLAYANMHYRWRWRDANAEFQRALALNPSYSHAHHWHSHCLMAQGCAAESLEASHRALELDPLDLVINVHLAWHYWFARAYDQTIEQSRQSAELEPTSPWPAFFAGMGHAARGEVGSAIAEHRRAVDYGADSPVMYAALGYSLALGGERKEAERVIARLNDVAARQHVSAYEIAIIHGTLGERDQMFDWLDRAYEERSAWLAYLAVDPRLDGVRDDERFRGLLRAVGLTTASGASTAE